MVEVYGDPPRQASLYVNSHSRVGEAQFQVAVQALKDLGLDLKEAQCLSDRRQFIETVQGQVASGTPMVIVGGGDGTLGSVANLFARSSAVLGVLPMGTGNAFARDLGLDVSVEQACKILLSGKTAQVDLGQIGDRNFLNVATIGLTAQIALGLNSEGKKIFGKAVYLISVMKALVKVQPFVVKLELPSGPSSFECLQLVIGNGRFHAGPFPISPDATITGPFLAIYALATRNKSAFLKMALHMANGTHVALDEVRYFRATSGSLNTVPSQDLIVDGERCFRTPQKFSMAEKALTVVVPQEFSG